MAPVHHDLRGRKCISLLGFGQPQTGVFQMAYVVEDIDASMRHWVEQLEVGPWFLLEHFTGERATATIR